MRHDLGNQGGVGTIAAVFVIVILAMLGTALIALTTTEQRATSREMASAHAFYAAETALQWGMYQVVQQSNTAGGNPFNGAPPGGLSACGNQTQASAATPFANNIPAVGGAVDLFRFQAVGVCNAGTPVETRRRLEVRFRQ